MPTLIEKKDAGAVAYACKLLDPAQLALLNHPIALALVKALAKKPAAASDLAKELGANEQKVYYHLRKLSKAGIIEAIGSERRHGLMANIYAAASPVVAAKLFESDGAMVASGTLEPAALAFFSPFVKEGSLNATIVIGSPLPHGQFGKSAYDGAYALELARFLGALAPRAEQPCYQFDTDLSEAALRRNLILIGSPLVNTVTGRLNPSFPLQFVEEQSMAILSKSTGRSYDDHTAGVVLKVRNPLNPQSFVLVLAGRRSFGTIAAIHAVTQQLQDLRYNPREEQLARVVIGKDRDSDGRVDHVAVVE